MHGKHEVGKAWVASVTLLSLWIAVAAGPVLARPTGARLEGLVIDANGRPATGAAVVLFDDRGETRARAVADDDGTYSLRDLPAGEYGMGVQLPDGVVAPVSSPPVRLSAGQLARRDLKLVEADAQTLDRALTANHGFGSWFGELSGGEKTGVVVGFVALTYLIYLAFQDDTTEHRASPMDPP